MSYIMRNGVKYALGKKYIMRNGTKYGGIDNVGMQDVNFYDYDGSLVHSYTKAEFTKLSAMPDNPTHEGLTSQGWNWSLADAKAYVNVYGKLNIGQMYNTSDGALRLYIHLEDGRLSPTLGICINGTVTVDWGDNSATETMTGSSVSTLQYLPHTYSQAGDYVISILPGEESKIGFGQRGSCSTILCKSQDDSPTNRYVYLNSIYKVELPNTLTTVNEYSLSYCYSLESITIPDSVTISGGTPFRACYSLKSMTVPKGVTVIGAYDCASLESIAIPNSVTDISDSGFNNCYSLSSVTLPTISFAGSAFSNCYSLSSLTLRASTRIASRVFVNCYSLTTIRIPSSVSTIENYAFASCAGLASIHFTRETPPTVAASNAFSSISTDCIIYAPALVINLYMNGTNYPNKSTYTYVGFATYESGVTLPSTTTDETHTLTWYANIDDLKAETNPITTGNGNEIYARATAI